jgi:hypothetical protein
MISVRFRPKADVVEILYGPSLSKVGDQGILKLIEERGIADVSATL